MVSGSIACAARWVVFAAVACLWVAGAALATPETCQLPRQTGPILLRIEIGDTVPPRRIALDRAGLQAMPQDAFSTTTIWTEGRQSFRGVRLWHLVRCFGVEDGVVTLIAKNDYLIDIPVAQLRPDGAMIAFERNGKPMTTREMGPLWLVYPYDADPAFRVETIYARSIWQLDRLRITP